MPIVSGSSACSAVLTHELAIVQKVGIDVALERRGSASGTREIHVDRWRIWHKS